MARCGIYKNPNYRKEYELKNKERIRERNRKYRLEHKEHTKKVQRKAYLRYKEKYGTRCGIYKNPNYKKEWELKNRDSRIKRMAEWHLENKEHEREYDNRYKKNKYHTNPNFKLLSNMRTGICRVLKGKTKVSRTMELVGCTIEELWQHLESRPTWEPWMTRENHGRNGWDVDHIRACANFDLSDPAQQRECFHYSNLQPMEHIENVKKGKK